MIAPYTDESMLSHISAGWDLSQLATLKIDEYGGHGQRPVLEANAKYFLETTTSKSAPEDEPVHATLLFDNTSCTVYYSLCRQHSFFVRDVFCLIHEDQG